MTALLSYVAGHSDGGYRGWAENDDRDAEWQTGDFMDAIVWAAHSLERIAEAPMFEPATPDAWAATLEAHFRRELKRGEEVRTPGMERHRETPWAGSTRLSTVS